MLAFPRVPTAGADQGAETAFRCPVNVHSVGMCRTMEYSRASTA